MAFWGKDLLVAFIHTSQRSRLTPSLDLRALAFTAGVSLFTGILFGLAPALRATSVALTPALKENSANQTAGGFRFGLGKGLVVLQVGASLILLVGAGLFLRTLLNLQHVNFGFDANNLLLFRVDPTLNGYKDQRLIALYEQLSEKLNSIPGVRTSTYSEEPLLAGQVDINGGLVVPESKAHVPEDTWIYTNKVGPTFMESMGIPTVIGRSFGSRDAAGARKVALVNQAFAKLYFPDDDPVGKRFKFDETDKEFIEIVGVARNAKYESLRGESPVTLYLPYSQDVENLGGLNFEVRTAGDPVAFVPLVRQALQSADSNLAISDVRTQREQVDESLSQERLFANFTAAFGVLALVLSCLGLYGVMSYSVARRINEIGLRMALGADPGRMIRHVMRESMVMVVVGVGLGAGASLIATKLIAAMLFGLGRN
ncbi:MAG: FtsX-like permease family protein, partial [Blastocatellia bacterium]